jgi:trehalose 6-phosphate phosphatase
MPPTLDQALEPLLADPDATGLFLDVDGTLAPIVERPEEAAVPESTRSLLERLVDRYALVACVSGRSARDARQLVGIAEIAYVGNHGLEHLAPGEEEPRPDSGLDSHEEDAAVFVAGLDDLAELELRVEDKGPIQALHWRGARNEGAAESRAHEIAADAEWRGLAVKWGRKVLEVRPPLSIGKGEAVRGLIERHGTPLALYGGDDVTDLDAFGALKRLQEEGRLDASVCVGISSPEGPAEIRATADVVVEGPEGFVPVLETLAEAG